MIPAIYMQFTYIFEKQKKTVTTVIIIKSVSYRRLIGWVYCGGRYIYITMMRV